MSPNGYSFYFNKFTQSNEEYPLNEGIHSKHSIKETEKRYYQNNMFSGKNGKSIQFDLLMKYSNNFICFKFAFKLSDHCGYFINFIESQKKLIFVSFWAIWERQQKN